MRKNIIICLICLSFETLVSQTGYDFYVINTKLDCMKSFTNFYKYDANFSAQNYTLTKYPTSFFSQNYKNASEVCIDRKNNLLFINMNVGLYLWDIANDTASLFQTDKIIHYAYSCKDSTMYALKYKDTLSTFYYYLYKIDIKNNLISPISTSSFYSNKTLRYGIFSPTIDEKNRSYCFIDSSYNIVSVSLSSGNVTNVLNTNLNSYQTNFSLNYNPNDSLLYSIISDKNTHTAFLCKINVSNQTIVTFSNNISSTNTPPFYSSYNSYIENNNQSTVLDFKNNTLYYNQIDASVSSYSTDIVMNKIDINSGSLLNSQHLFSSDDITYLGFTYAQPCFIPNKINEENSNEISITPNPTTDKVYINHLTSKFSHIQLYDNLGKIVLEKSVNRDDNEFSLSDFASGIYYLKIEGCKTFKLIKQ